MEHEISIKDNALTNTDNTELTLAQDAVSELFTIQTSINPLIAAAQPLLSIIQRLNLTNSIQGPIELKRQINRELDIFRLRAHEAGFSEEAILVGRYLLCATIDEMFSQLEWDSINDYLAIGRFTPQHGEGPKSDERFFLILEKIFATPNDHLELLELAYLCISFGFEGKYRETSNKREALDGLLDKVYDLIKGQRGEAKNNLLISTKLLHQQQNQFRPFSITTLVLTVILVVSLSLIGFNMLLGQEIDSDSLIHTVQSTPSVEVNQHG